MRLFTCVIACLAIVAPAQSGAQSVSAETAQSLQQQLHDAIASIMPNGWTSPHPSVSVEDDHYRVSLPLPGLEGAAATSQAWPLDQGRWRLADIQMPSPIQFTANMPRPGNDTERAPVTYVLKIGAQNSAAEFDPQLRTRSRLTMDVRDLDLRGDGPDTNQQQQIDRYKSEVTLAPRSDGRLDLAQESDIAGWKLASRVGDTPAVALGADRMKAVVRVTGMDRDRAGALVTAVTSLLATLPSKAPGSDAAPLTPAERDALHAVIGTLSGAFESVQGEETIEGIEIGIAGVGQALIQRLRLGMGGEAPQNLLDGWMEIALDGVSIPGLPPPADGLAPRHVRVRPSLRGVSMNALMKLAADATQEGADPAQLQAQALGLLARHPVTLALDPLAFDVGPAEVKGTGQIVVTSLADYQADARITATGLDALMQRVQGDPELQQAIPVLALMRGFARTEGDHLVWNVTARNGSVKVNGLQVVAPPTPSDDAPNAAPRGNRQPRSR